MNYFCCSRPPPQKLTIKLASRKITDALFQSAKYKVDEIFGQTLIFLAI